MSLIRSSFQIFHIDIIENSNQWPPKQPGLSGFGFHEGIGLRRRPRGPSVLRSVRPGHPSGAAGVRTPGRLWSAGSFFFVSRKSTDLRISQIWLGAFRHCFNILRFFFKNYGSSSREKKTGGRTTPLIDVLLMLDVWNHQPGRRSLHSTEWSVFLI